MDGNSSSRARSPVEQFQALAPRMAQDRRLRVPVAFIAWPPTAYRMRGRGTLRPRARRDAVRPVRRQRAICPASGRARRRSRRFDVPGPDDATKSLSPKRPGCTTRSSECLAVKGIAANARAVVRSCRTVFCERLCGEWLVERHNRARAASTAPNHRGPDEQDCSIAAVGDDRRLQRSNGLPLHGRDGQG